MTDDYTALVDVIYEAAVLPDLWPSVLDSLTRYGDGDGTLLFSIDEQGFRYVASTGFEDIVAAYVAEGWPTRTDRAARLFARQHAGFLTDLDVYTQEEYRREAVYNDFLRPRGLGWGTASAIVVPTGDRLVFNIERGSAKGPVPSDVVARLDRLRPHLARAATMSARLRLQTVRAAAQALDLVGLPTAVLGRQGQILEMNALCEALPTGTILEGRRLTLGNVGADRLLATALEGLHTEVAASVRSIPLPPTDLRAPMVVHLLPIRRQATDLFQAAAALAVITPVAQGIVPAISVLEGLFDLTSAEARTARAVASCRSISEIAAETGLSKETVRSQLKRVLAKTGVGRQSELVGLLAGTGF